MEKGSNIECEESARFYLARPHRPNSAQRAGFEPLALRLCIPADLAAPYLVEKDESDFEGASSARSGYFLLLVARSLIGYRGAATMATSSNGDGGRSGRGGDESTPGHQARLDSYVPTFDNQQKNYREFRKRCELYRRKMQMGNRQSETVFNIVTLLQGKAWDLVEDFSVEQLAAENAFEAVFARLDSGFTYDPLTELPDDFELFFIKLQRKGGQTLQDYMTDFTKAERRLKNSHQVELPEKVKAWWFLRRSGITREQRQMILTNVGVSGLAMDTVMKAMSFILGQDSKTEGNMRFGKSYSKAEVYYHREEDDDYDWVSPDPDDLQLPVYYMSKMMIAMKRYTA